MINHQLQSPRTTRATGGRKRGMKTGMALASVLITGAVGLAACGNDNADNNVNDDAAPTASEENQAETNPLALSNLIVDEAATPEGFSYYPPGDVPADEQIKGIIEGRALADATTVDPEWCAGLAVDGVTMTDWMFRSADTTVTAGYTSEANPEDGIFVMATRDDVDPETYPDNVDEDCAHFSRDLSNDSTGATQHYEAQGRDIPVDGAEVLSAAHVVVASLEANGQSVDGAELGAPLTLVTAVVDDVSFTVTASGDVPDELISDVATAQAQRIADAG